MILETVLLRHHQVAALVLGHLDLPLPGGRGAPSVDVDVDLVTLGRGGHPHVLPSVGAADDGRCGAPWVTDRHGVSGAVSEISSVKVGVGSSGISGVGDGGGQHHRVKVNPQLADIRAGFAEGVGAGVRVRGGGVGADQGVGVVSGAGRPAADGEHAAHPEGGGAGPGGGAALGLALGGSVASAVVAVGRGARVIREGDHIEHAEHLLVSPPDRVLIHVSRGGVAAQGRQ